MVLRETSRKSTAVEERVGADPDLLESHQVLF